MDGGTSIPVSIPSTSSTRRSGQPYSSSPLSQSAMAEGVRSEDEHHLMDAARRRGSEWVGGPLDVSSAGPSDSGPGDVSQSPQGSHRHHARERSNSTSPSPVSKATYATSDRMHTSQSDSSFHGIPSSPSSTAFVGPSSPSALPPASPSSAPATPSLAAITHPSPFIHTHHPKRSSPTPLSLNLISPVGPVLHSAGTSPPTSLLNDRRSSAASSRREGTGQSHYTPSNTSGRRRSSLTPSISTLAAANTTKAHAFGYPADATLTPSAPRLQTRTRTDDGTGRLRTTTTHPLLQELAAMHMQGRRGSMPHIGNFGTSRFLPSLQPQRPSGGEEGAFEGLEGFRFGSGSTISDVSKQAQAAATAALFPSTAPQGDDVFAEAEAAEAEKQRRAFLDATFGAAGKRARERLSIGGPGGLGTGTPRRESLLLWNQVGWAGLNEPGELGAGPLEFGGRRGSLPVAIPKGGHIRLTKKEQKRQDKEEREADGTAADASAELVDDEDDDDDDDDDEETEELTTVDDATSLLRAPVRPLPPLLPLSDPGPRLLPSTLALHRANHLLTARNLEAAPLPHPLPPSLHPPAPVDLAEFDIDFILAGSQAQLGRDKRKSTKGSRRTSEKTGGRERSDTQTSALPPTPTLQLGKAGEEEDTFAKFVGEFDDEYGGRRGEWTFRSCSPSRHSGAETSRDGALSPQLSALATPMAEWESQGAGRYELYSTGEVLSVDTGRIWQVRRTGSREFELEKVSDWHGPAPSSSKMLHSETPTASFEVPVDRPSTHTGVAVGTTYVMAAKLIHREEGGVKAPVGVRKASGSSTPRSARASSRNQSIHRRNRPESEDSSTTALPSLSRSLPVDTPVDAKGFSNKHWPSGHSGETSLPSAETSASKRRDSLATGEKPRERGFAGLPRHSSDIIEKYADLPPLVKAHQRENAKDRRARMKEYDPQDEKAGKKDRSFGSVIKRGWLASINRTAGEQEKRERRQERERERVQSQSWSGASSTSSNWSNGGPPNIPSSVQYPGHVATSSQMAAGRLRSDTEAVTREMTLPLVSRGSSDVPASGRSLGIEDEQNGGLPWQEGKAWYDVPEEAMAMVIPFDECACKMESTDSSNAKGLAGREATQQALLVYFVPFNSSQEHRRTTVFAAEPSSPISSTPSSTSHRLLHGAKLLRRKGSKEKEAMQRELRGTDIASAPAPPLSGQPAGNFVLHPLPFRSFRLVARVVNIADLQSEPTTPSWSNVGAGALDSRSIDAWASASGNDVESSVPAGRNFPTVIAVCHSRSQGVEFVLEGLDRLGLCEGQSAWGPTGYEEWRGSGLSEKGRAVLDLLWAGCTGVMGLSSV